MSPKWAHLWRYLSWRCSPTYRRTLRMLHATDGHPRAFWQRWQFEQVRTVLLHAARNVRYYRDAFRAAGLEPNNFRSLDEIQNYPTLTKEIYRQNVEAFVADGTDRSRLIRAYTGGTTGEPVPLIRECGDVPRERAFAAYVYRMLGIDPHCKKVYIRGPADDGKGRYYFFTEFGRTLRLSSHNLSDENLSLYVGLIRSFRPQLLFATPSVTMVLCQYLERNRQPPFENLRWAFAPSENLYPFQEEFIREVLRCRVCTSYGHSEHVVSAGRCDRSRLYHVLPQYGYTELLDEAGHPVTREGQTGEIVGTSFTNACCPLIRYRTGDYAVFTTDSCPCGREFPMWKSVQGREPAIAYGKTGGAVSVGPELLCNIWDRAYSRIRQFSIEQRRPGELVIHVVPYAAEELPEIASYFQSLFSARYPGQFAVEVQGVPELRLSSPGKHRYFVQHLLPTR